MCWQRDREGIDARRKGREEMISSGTGAWVTYSYTASNNGGAHNYCREGQPICLL